MVPSECGTVERVRRSWGERAESHWGEGSRRGGKVRSYGIVGHRLWFLGGLALSVLSLGLALGSRPVMSKEGIAATAIVPTLELAKAVATASPAGDQPQGRVDETPGLTPVPGEFTMTPAPVTAVIWTPHQTIPPAKSEGAPEESGGPDGDQKGDVEISTRVLRPSWLGPVSLRLSFP